MEHLGREPNTAYQTIHGPAYSGGGIGAPRDIGQDYANAFHLFRVDRNSRGITFSIDGVTVISIDKASAAPTAQLGPTDAAYVQLAIPQAESALPLLDLVTARETPLAPLAREIAANHGTELDRLHAILRDHGLPYVDEHRGHDMPGMVTAPEVAGLGPLTGPEFDTTAKALIKAHLEESAAVARVEQASGKDTAPLALVADHVRAREAHLAKLSGS